MAWRISKEQAEVLEMYNNQYMSPKDIAIARQTSLQAVYKTIGKLRKKGLIKKGFRGVGVEKPRHEKKSLKLLRLHNIHESIGMIAEPRKKYWGLLEKGNKIHIKDVTVMLYKDNIQIYTSEGLSFYGRTTDECYLKAIIYFKKLYLLLENDLGILIDKDRKLNKKWVRQHIAEMSNEVARDANDRKERIVVKDTKDGKEAIITDRSFNLDELEFIHPEKGKKDTDRVVGILNDMREKESLLPSQMSDFLKQTQQQVLQVSIATNNNALTLSSVLQLIKASLPKPYEETKEEKIKPEYIG